MVTIVLRRRTGGFAALRRLRVRLDGRPVGRLRTNRTLELTGSGGPQQLSVSIERAGSNQLTVVDPGTASVLEVDVLHRGLVDSILRSSLAPESVLVLIPAGQVAPPPPPIRPGWRKVVRLWLLIAAGAAVLAAFQGWGDGHVVDLSGVAGAVAGVSVGFGLLVAAGAVVLRHQNRGSR